MMQAFRFGKRSRKALVTCHHLLQYVFKTALATGLIDIAIIEGRRDKARQNRLYAIGKSKLQWPKSKHNVLVSHAPSMAVDAAPYVNGKVSWNKDHCIFLAGVVLATAKRLKVPVRWGGNWDMDGEPVTDQDFQDLVHYELVDDGQPGTKGHPDRDLRAVRSSLS